MSNDICLLLTIITRELELVRIAVKINGDNICDDFIKYYKEPAVQAELQRILPDRITELGTIVEIMEIFDVCDIGINGDIR